MSTKPFNPFREALAFLQTSQDLDRGGIVQKHNAVQFICWAFVRVQQVNSRKENLEGWLLTKQAKAHVVACLGGKNCIEVWLYANVKEYGSALYEHDDDLRWAVTQAYRWRWMNHLADQYDAGLIKLD